MRFETIDPADTRYRWAKRIFSAQESCIELSGQEIPPVSMWCNRVEESGFSISAIDWVAYQVLQGDESNWQSASCRADSDVVRSQGEQIRVFSQIFFSLTTKEKRKQFALLAEQSKENSFAMQHLERFRPFLDLDLLESYSVNPDVIELTRTLVGQHIDGPAERKSSVQELLSLSAANPQRWKDAATELQSRHPHFAQLAPSLIDRILYWKKESPTHASDRKTFKRRYAFRLLQCRLVEQLHAQTNPKHVIAACVFVFFVVAVFPITWKIIRVPDSNPSQKTFMPNLFSPHNPPVLDHKQQELQLEAIYKFISPVPKAKKAINLLPTTEQAVIFENLEKQWRKTALTQGSDGLKAIETKLQLDSEIQSIKPDALIHGLRLFKNWRSDIGDAIARRVDGLKLNLPKSEESSKSILPKDQSQIESAPHE